MNKPGIEIKVTDLKFVTGKNVPNITILVTNRPSHVDPSTQTTVSIEEKKDTAYFSQLSDKEAKEYADFLMSIEFKRLEHKEKQKLDKSNMKYTIQVYRQVSGTLN